MKYSELEDYSLLASLEHHLSNVDELMNYDEDDNELSEPLSPSDIMEMVENNNDRVLVWERYEDCSYKEVAGFIDSFAYATLHNYIDLLKKVNGKEWFENWKAEK